MPDAPASMVLVWLFSNPPPLILYWRLLPACNVSSQQTARRQNHAGSCARRADRAAGCADGLPAARAQGSRIDCRRVRPVRRSRRLFGSAPSASPRYGRSSPRPRSRGRDASRARRDRRGKSTPRPRVAPGQDPQRQVDPDRLMRLHQRRDRACQPPDRAGGRKWVNSLDVRCSQTVPCGNSVFTRPLATSFPVMPAWDSASRRGSG